MATHTRRVQSRYETCVKRSDGESVVCEIEIVVQDTETGFITIEQGEILVPASLAFADAIAEFEAQRMALDAQGNEQ